VCVCVCVYLFIYRRHDSLYRSLHLFQQQDRIQADIPTSAAGSRIGRYTYLKSRIICICDPAPEVGNRPVYDPAAEVVISTCIYYRAAEVGIAACIYDPTFEAVCRPTYDPATGVGISVYIRCDYRTVRPLYVAS